MYAAEFFPFVLVDVVLDEWGVAVENVHGGLRGGVYFSLESTFRLAVQCPSVASSLFIDANQ